MKQNNRLLKDQLVEAIVSGVLSAIEEREIVFTLKKFKVVFSDIKTDYINSFLPAATIEPGRETMTRTTFLFRVRKGGRVHPALLSVSEKNSGRMYLLTKVLSF